MSLFAPQVYDAVSAYYRAFDKLARKGIIQPVRYSIDYHNIYLSSCEIVNKVLNQLF